MIFNIRYDSTLSIFKSAQILLLINCPSLQYLHRLSQGTESTAVTIMLQNPQHRFATRTVQHRAKSRSFVRTRNTNHSHVIARAAEGQPRFLLDSMSEFNHVRVIEVCAFKASQPRCLANAKQMIVCTCGNDTCMTLLMPKVPDPVAYPEFQELAGSRVLLLDASGNADDVQVRGAPIHMHGIHSISSVSALLSYVSVDHGGTYSVYEHEQHT